MEASVRLLERLEAEVPERVGRGRAHGFIGIFPFLNWGVLKGLQPFDLQAMRTPKRVRLFELAYRHMVHELTGPARGILKGPWLNLGFRLLGPVGFHYLSRIVDGVVRGQLRRAEGLGPAPRGAAGPT